jgi:hypothetical protein
MGHTVVKDEDCDYFHWKGYPVEVDSREPRENLTPEALKSWEDSFETRSMTQNFYYYFLLLFDYPRIWVASNYILLIS